jgi:hypothetical protein
LGAFQVGPEFDRLSQVHVAHPILRGVRVPEGEDPDDPGEASRHRHLPGREEGDAVHADLPGGLGGKAEVRSSVTVKMMAASSSWL